MILPWPEDLKSYHRYPLTLTLVALNVLIFTFLFSGSSDSKLSQSPLLKAEGLTLTGRIYYQYLQSLSPSELYEKPEWVRQMKSANSEQMGVLGGYALRDARFLEKAEGLQVKGDELQVEQWQRDLVHFRKSYQEQRLFLFGLSSTEMGPRAWLTYQFSHSNWVHLFSNLIFLIMMGVAVEILAGSYAVLIVYLLGGAFGGLSFLLSAPQGAVPMVGASASISALLGFFVAAEVRKRIRFLYFLSPLPGQYGAIYLPTLLIVPLFLLVDLASFWASPEGLGGGVAYAAHLGGALSGAVMGLLYRWFRARSLSFS